MTKTQPISTTNWRIQFPATQPEPRRRYPRNTASMAVTQPLRIAPERP